MAETPTTADTADLVTDTVRVAGRELLIAHPRAAEDLIDEDDYARDERLPYWADLWPSARMLAAELAARHLAGMRVLELGCGVGLPAIVAALGGARVLATDWYGEALGCARANADSNGATIETMLVDWRSPPAALVARAPFDLIVGADVLYEQRNGIALAALLPPLAGSHTEVVIADPRRPHSVELTDRLAAAGWSHATRDIRHSARVDEAGPAIRLHTLRAPRG
jgi:predicted nicotinamide N-methyase